MLTAWLRQGLRSGICPLCRVAHKADREYIWHFFDEGADRGESIDEVRRAYGFCSEHIEMLRRIETEGMGSTLAISTMFADTFAGIVADLDALAPESPFRRAACPACANREEQLRANAGYLLDDLKEHGRKHDHRVRDEPKGPERDSWRRAVYMTAGWPASNASAGEPEVGG
ncbi:MAG: hypothetical protein ACRDL5_08290 [Solirubrobacteraceae bacterium]